MVRDGEPPPEVLPGRPVANIYVDNCGIVGYCREDTQKALDAVLRELDRRRLSYHGVVQPCRRFVLLGVSIDLDGRRALQTPERA